MLQLIEMKIKLFKIFVKNGKFIVIQMDNILQPLNATHVFKSDLIVQTTGDNPFVDPVNRLWNRNLFKKRL